MPREERTRISAIVPVLDEAQALPGLLAQLQHQVHEIVVVDGGSRDGSGALAAAAGARVVRSAPGRGPQLDAGACVASCPILWFLHADSQVASGSGAALIAAAQTHRWGCFEVQINSSDPRLLMTAALMTRRAQRGGCCTGDMGIWARRSFFEELGGFGPLSAFEDLAFSDRARRRQPAAVLQPALTTSARRWQTLGTNRTIARLWALRLAYRVGVSPQRLSRHYRRHPR